MTSILPGAGAALLVLLGGSIPWAGFGPLRGLSTWNQHVGTTLPWSIVPMALYLWAYFSFIGGRWGAGGATCRRNNLRANPLPWRVWGVALPAGLLGFGAILAYLALSARLIRMPDGESIVAPAGMPVSTMFALLVMQSVVAGVTEESAFRGYMQSIVARRSGETIAILASGALFGLLHFPNHPADVAVMLPYYIVVSAMYGGLTWAANSIWPALVLHCVGDIVMLTRWWLTGYPEWQLSATMPSLVWESGIDVGFIATLLVAVVLSAATLSAYRVVRARRLQSGPVLGRGVS